MCEEVRIEYTDVPRTSLINQAFRTMRAKWTSFKSIFCDDADVYKINQWNLLLKVLGLRRSTPPTKVNIYEPSNARIHAIKSFNNCDCFLTVIIFLFILSHPIYEISKYAMTNDWNESAIVHLLLESMIPIHYLFSYIYFYTDHIDYFTRRDGGQGIEFSTVVSRPCRMTPNSLAKMSIISSSIITLISIVNYEEEYVAWVILQRFIGFTILSINIFSLIYIFWKHINAVQSYANVIEDGDRRMKYTQITLACFIKNIIELRESLRVTRSLFSDMVSFSVILCGVVMGIVINSDDFLQFDLWVYISLISFCILYSFLIFIIWQLSESKEYIQRIIQGSAMARRYLVRGSVNRTRNRIFETATSVDWWILKTELDKKWIEFTVMGIPIHNGTFIKQVVTTVALLQVFGRNIITRRDE